jgi:hypothetical protein
MEPNDFRDIPDYGESRERLGTRNRKIAAWIDGGIIEVYDNAAKAAEEMMIPKATVYYLISTGRESAQGYTLKYLSETEDV